MELGYLGKLADQMAVNFKIEFPRKNQIFRTVQEYVDANTFVDDLDFNKISVFFYFYLSMASFFSMIQLLFSLTLVIYRWRRKL